MATPPSPQGNKQFEIFQQSAARARKPAPLYIKTSSLLSRMTNCRETFDAIYRRGAWGGNSGDGSGTGSEPVFTTKFRKTLIGWMKVHQVRTLLDCPCGAGKWTQLMIREATEAIPGFQYIGVDVSSIAIERAKRNLATIATANVTLILDDMTAPTTPLPRADLVLCRDALQHLSPTKIKCAIANLFAIGAKWVMIGGSETGVNRSISDGEYFDFNPIAPPYSMKPVEVFAEGHSGSELQKSIFVFDSEKFYYNH